MPPFISDEIIERELQRHGQIVSAIKKIPVGCKSPLLKHVVSFRRQLYMILKNDMEELNIVLKFRIEGFDYVIFATTETMKCFRCNKQGHLARSCPEQVASFQSDVQDKAQTSSAKEKRAGVSANGSESENRAHQSNEESTVGNPRENGEMESVEGRKSEVKDSDIIEAETSQREANEHSEIDLDEEGLIMNEEINMFKVPVVKRKADKSEKGSKSKALRKSQEVVKDKEGTDEASDDSSADDSSVFSYGEAEVVELMEHEGRMESGYSLERVQKFLSSTKGKRNVVATDFFPDRELFIDSAKFLMKQRGEGCLSSQDIHRLKKCV